MEVARRPKNKNIIRSKWVFNDDRKVVSNKEKLVWKGYAQVEGVEFEENFSHVSRLEEIRIFLAFSSHMKFKFYHMDVKSTFQNGELEEEVYVEKHEGL